MALHTAARRFCQKQHSHWTQLYSEQRQRVSKFDSFGDYSYSNEDYAVFPRYRFDNAALEEVERIVPTESGAFEELRVLLIAAATESERKLLGEFKEHVALEAIRAESAELKQYLGKVSMEDLSVIEPLPYRRVLSDEEARRIWSLCSERWRVGNSYWFPLAEVSLKMPMLAFHTDYFSSMRGNETLQKMLERRGVARFFELHELGSPEYESELSILRPQYGSGCEAYYTSEAMDWLVYASHESSITIAGDWLVDEFRRLWPDCEGRTYQGPFFTEDLRGTWEFPPE